MTAGEERLVIIRSNSNDLWLCSITDSALTVHGTVLCCCDNISVGHVYRCQVSDEGLYSDICIVLAEELRLNNPNMKDLENTIL